jgi:carbonic anhydrase/acetyltransferase-like protein (isoleucine patch superfamily)
MSVYALGEVRPHFPPPGQFWIAPSAAVIGRVRLEQDASVWFGAVLRGDNEPITIGERSNIQDLCLIHTDPGYPAAIGSDCTIGHRAILHGCTIGNGSLVGMGAIILNGAVIGRSCLIGAGALIPENKVIPDGALVVGAPGKVIRELEAAVTEKLLGSAANYVANWRRFAAQLASASD